MSRKAAVSGPLAAWCRLVRSHPLLVIALCLGVTSSSLAYAASNLGIDSNTIELFPEDLPARRNHDAFVAIFPDLENALLIVVDGATPEATREATEGLLSRLESDRANFEDVYLPGGGPFFEDHALLYRSVEEIDRFGDNLARIQPVIGELRRDRSIGNLASLIRTGLEQVESDSSDPELWSAILDRVGHASVEIYREYPIAVSWEELMLRGSAIESVTRRILLAQPVLDFSDALPARAPLEAIRAAILEVGAKVGHSVRVRVTGNPALVHEETLGLVWDIGVSGLLSLLLVSGILVLALRSLPLVSGVVITLLTGLIWTGGFAALAVGDLNVISVAAGVLFVGLGADFGIHLGMRYGDLLRAGLLREQALDQAVADVGGSLVVCTLTTAIGFFAFLPTDYQGVAELGLITGVGLIIMLLLTLTLFPALMTSLLRVDPARLRQRRLRFGAAPGSWVAQHARGVRRGFLVLGIAGASLIPGLRFDANIVAMRDPSTESVQTFNELLEDAGRSSPWFANSVAANLEEANALKQRLQKLEAVERAITLSDYVPEDQDEKLEILMDLSLMMDGSGRASGAPQLAIEEQVAALRSLHELLLENAATVSSPTLRLSMLDLQGKLGDFLAQAERPGQAHEALAQLDVVLLTSLPAQLDRLQRALDAQAISLEKLPPRLVRRLRAPDGRARVQIFPSENLVDHAAFERFVAAVQSVDPQTTGVSVNLVEFARTTREAFRQAIATAVVAITFILWLRWRRLSDMLLVLVPLALAAILTTAAMVAIGLPLSFFNVVVVPLLLGAGVDSGIHLVEQSRGDGSEQMDLLDTTTARAVFFSALTTVASFGTLALSSHVGLSGLGTLLTIGMLLSLLCNLMLLPALLALRSR